MTVSSDDMHVDIAPFARWTARRAVRVLAGQGSDTIIHHPFANLSFHGDAVNPDDTTRAEPNGFLPVAIHQAVALLDSVQNTDPPPSQFAASAVAMRPGLCRVSGPFRAYER